MTELEVPRAWEAAMLEAFGDLPRTRAHVTRIGIVVALIVASLAVAALLVWHA